MAPSARPLPGKLTGTLVERFQRWAIRGRRPEPMPIRLDARRVYVLPTRAGLAYAGALLVLYLGAINYSLSLGHALVYLLMGVGCAAILATFRNLAQLEFGPGHCPPTVAGTTARFGLVLHNPDALTRYALSLTPRDGQVTWLGELSPASTTELPLEIPAPRRGRLHLPRVTVETRFPLGLIRSWAYLEPELSVIVYPAPAADAPPPRGLGRGDARQEQHLGDDDFHELRRHRPGDALAHVAWKAAARQADAPLLTKTFTTPAGHDNHFDWADLRQEPDTERRLSILARWVLDAATRQEAWRLSLPGATFDTDQGEAHYHRCMEALALHGLP